METIVWTQIGRTPTLVPLRNKRILPSKGIDRTKYNTARL